MKRVFVDTSFFIAAVDGADQDHSMARDFVRTNLFPLITTSAIVLELGAYFSRASFRVYFGKCLKMIELGKIEVVHIDEQLQGRGVEFFQKRPDKNWSLTDCTSFVVMNDLAIREAATSDEHFEQAGFAAVLRNRAVADEHG